MAEGYKWRPFSDLPADPRILGDSELEALHRVWMDQKKSLEESGALDLFNQRLRREWAIETGVIEGVYTLDRGTTETLLEHGIKASLIPRESNRQSPEHVALILQDHSDVLEGLFAYVREERSLSVGYIKELHAALLRHQETSTVVDQFGNQFERKIEKGQYKSLPNNPFQIDGAVHEYCPPEHVASEMDRMIERQNKRLE